MGCHLIMDYKKLRVANFINAKNILLAVQKTENKFHLNDNYMNMHLEDGNPGVKAQMLLYQRH